MKRCILLFFLLLSLAGVARADVNLADLIEAERREAALELIQAGADVNARQGDGTSALHWAVYQVDPELTSLLLAREADPDVRNLFGTTPLMEAVKVANVELVRLLLEAGADPNLANQDGQTPLMLAARTGVVPIARLLVEHGAEVNVVEAWRGQTPLMWAAARNHPDMASFLIEQGADIEVRADAFDWERQITSEPRAQYRPTGGMTPLLYAARGGCLDCVKDMLAAGADIDLPTPDGVTPLMVAIDNYHFDLARYLLDQNANPHSWDWWGRTPLYVAIDVNSLRTRFGEQPSQGNQEYDALAIARLLLEAGVNPNSQLNMHRPGRGGGSGRFTDDLLQSGATPLLRAAKTHDVEAIRLLLEYGALVDLPTVQGVTPFLAAAGFGSPTGTIDGTFGSERQPQAIAALEELLAAGADIHARVTDTTSRNANIARQEEMTDRQGQTAVYAAISEVWPDVLTWLVEQGARLDVEDDFGKTPLDAARNEAGGEVEPSPEEIEMMVALVRELSQRD